jgi:hypothetical protein
MIKDLFTEKDGESFCPSRLLLILGGIVFLTLAVYSVLHGKEFNAQDFGLGYGGLLGGGGAGIALKGRTE